MSDIKAGITSEIYSVARTLGVDTAKVFVMDEQEFVHKIHFADDCYYIVIEHQPSVPNPAVNAQNVILSGVSQANDVMPIMNLLTALCDTYTLKVSTEIGGLQIWQTPRVKYNFEEVAQAYRSTVTMSGTLVISDTLLYETVTYKGSSLFVAHLTFRSSSDLDPEPFSSSNAVTKAVAKAGTDTMTVVLFPTSDNALFTDVWAAVAAGSAARYNTYAFTVTIGGVTATRTMVMADFEYDRKLGNSGTCVVTFAGA
jgi:hypothetical protein